VRDGRRDHLHNHVGLAHGGADVRRDLAVHTGECALLPLVGGHGAAGGHGVLHATNPSFCVDLLGRPGQIFEHLTEWLEEHLEEQDHYLQ
jgi:hypothetical protein